MSDYPTYYSLCNTPFHASIRCAALDALRVTFEIDTYTNNILALETFSFQCHSALCRCECSHTVNAATQTSDIMSPR
jgi:hypothetical protein